MTSLPQTMKALVVQEGRTVKVEDIPIPALDENEVLVKVHSIAQNPTDWKYVDSTSPPGNISGCDFSGTVVKLGSDSITHIKLGDTVSGFVHGGNHKDRGAFAQYVRADSDLVWKFSPNNISFEEAATMNCALWTGIQAFYHRMGLNEPSSPRPSEGQWILIYGGSTSLGLFSTQLAKLSGYKVITTVSPRNSDLLKSLGADVVIDYKSPDVVEQIKKATGNSLKFAFDTVSEANTQAVCIQSLAPAEGTTPGKVVVVLMPDNDAKSLRSDVVVQHTILYTCLGRSFTWGPGVYFPASSEDRAHMASWIPKLERLVSEGKVKPNPVKLWPGGLGAVSDGFQYMREGKVSAEKIVYNVE